jgi:hypothetical protein
VFYKKFFQPIVKDIASGEKFDLSIKDVKLDKLKTADTIRLNNMNSNIEQMSSTIIEYIFLNFVKEMMTMFSTGNSKYAFYELLRQVGLACEAPEA